MTDLTICRQVDRAPLPQEFRQALLGDGTSRANKLWCVISWEQRFDVEWRWQGEAMRSRLQFRFGQGPWLTARSFDQDIVPKFDDPARRMAQRGNR